MTESIAAHLCDRVNWILHIQQIKLGLKFMAFKIGNTSLCSTLLSTLIFFFIFYFRNYNLRDFAKSGGKCIPNHFINYQAKSTTTNFLYSMNLYVKISIESFSFLLIVKYILITATISNNTLSSRMCIAVYLMHLVMCIEWKCRLY